jgi:hypothetical protein
VEGLACNWLRASAGACSHWPLCEGHCWAARTEVTVQGNCSQEPGPGVLLGPPRRTDRQCVITVREDFLEFNAARSHGFVSDLYVQLPGYEAKEHSTLVGIKKGNLYLANMTFVGDGVRARAVDAHEKTSVYMTGAHASTSQVHHHRHLGRARRTRGVTRLLVCTSATSCTLTANGCGRRAAALGECAR